VTGTALPRAGEAGEWLPGPQRLKSHAAKRRPDWHGTPGPVSGLQARNSWCGLTGGASQSALSPSTGLPPTGRGDITTRPAAAEGPRGLNLPQATGGPEPLATFQRAIRAGGRPHQQQERSSAVTGIPFT